MIERIGSKIYCVDDEFYFPRIDSGEWNIWGWEKL